MHGAYILARYSTDNQNPDSIEVQVEKCSAWCAREGLPVLDVFADFAVSGMKDTRPQYARMMARLKEPGHADTVVILDQSRMFRAMTEWFAFRQELETLGVRVVSVTQPFVGGDLTDPANFMAEGTMALFNQMWVLQTRQKVKAKMEYMAKNCQHTGGNPAYGYQTRDGRLEIRPDEAAVVHRIFTLKSKGYSYREICDILNKDGITTRAGKPWGVTTIHDMLLRERYMGRMIYGKTHRGAHGRVKSTGPEDQIIVDNGCPAIVSQELWEAARATIKGSQYTGGRKYKDDYLLKGKVYCGLCGGSMTLRYSKSHTYAYYACCQKSRNRTCDAKPLKAEILEQAVVDAVVAQLGAPDCRDKLLAILAEQRGRVQSGAGQQLAQINARLADVSKKLNNATDAILQGLTSQALIDKIKQLEAQRDGLEYQKRTMQAQIDTVSIDDDTLAKMLQRILSDKSAPAILSIVHHVELHPDTIKIWTILDNTPPTDPKNKTQIPIPDIPDGTLNCSVHSSGTNSYWYLVIGFQAKRPPR